VAFLTTKEAAELLSQGLRRRVKARRLEAAIRGGRIRGEKGPRPEDPYLIPAEVVEGILQANRENPDPAAEVWDMIPPRSTDLLWWTSWTSRRSPRPARSEPPRPDLKHDDLKEKLRKLDK
jgi:hypothetical protein